MGNLKITAVIKNVHHNDANLGLEPAGPGIVRAFVSSPDGKTGLYAEVLADDLLRAAYTLRAATEPEVMP